MSIKILRIVITSVCLSFVLVSLNFFSQASLGDKIRSDVSVKFSDKNLSDEEKATFLQGISAAEAARGVIITPDMTAEEVHSNSFVTYVRTSLNNYLAGRIEGIEEQAITTSQPDCGLSVFDSAYYKSPFILFDVQNGTYGGVFADIIFLDKPDSLFSAWVYQYGTGELVLRNFCKVGPSKERKEDFDVMMKEIIESKDYYKSL